MPIQLLAPERFLEVQAAMRAQDAAAQPEVVNEEAVDRLGAFEILSYRGRRFRVGPTSYQHGRRLDRISRRFKELATTSKARPLTADEERETDNLVGDSLRLFGEMVRPQWARLKWLRWLPLPNPFHDASEAEVGALLGFFQGCRYQSGVAFRFPNPGRTPGR